MITSLCNLHIGGIVWRRTQTRGFGIIDRFILTYNQEAASLECLLNDLHDAAPCPRANDCVRLRQFVKQLLTVTLSEASGHNEAPAPPCFLIVGHSKHRRNGLLFCRLDECTCIDDQDICLSWLICYIDTMLTHNAEHNLRINEILCTTETDKACFH